MTPARYRDPTFDAVARNESRDCHGCKNLAYLWGMLFCRLEHWKGERNMKRCDSWTWSGRSE